MESRYSIFRHWTDYHAGPLIVIAILIVIAFLAVKLAEREVETPSLPQYEYIGNYETVKYLSGSHFWGTLYLQVSLNNGTEFLIDTFPSHVVKGDSVFTKTIYYTFPSGDTAKVKQSYHFGQLPPYIN